MAWMSLCGGVSIVWMLNALGVVLSSFQAHFVSFIEENEGALVTFLHKYGGHNLTTKKIK
jgi:hypothetical protein